jgi:polyisoprenyl-teichoic acid--peptidoglycan teichoic acid transferase
MQQSRRKPTVDPVFSLLILASSIVVLFALFLTVRDVADGRENQVREETRAAIIAFNATKLASIPTVLPTQPPMPATWTLPPSATITDTPSQFPSDTRTPTPSKTPTITPTPSDTPTLTNTPTYTPSITRTPTFTPSPYRSPTPTRPLPAGAPPPAAEIPANGNDMFNILLIGGDARPGDKLYRTDTLMIVSVNRTTRTVALLSIPRDMYVFIQQHGYDRINTALEYGELRRWPGGGVELLRSTLTNYLGIPIHRWARINFTGFKQIIEQIGGVDIANDCPLTDYRLIPGRKEGIEANYRWSTLPVGVHHFGGIDALWYARSRTTTSDFDRARRQQLVLRAIYRKALDAGTLANLPTLWSEITKIVDTNLNVGDIVALLPLATELDGTRLKSYVIAPPVLSETITDTGAAVLLPQAAALRALMLRFYTPPTANTTFTEKPVIEVYNASSHPDWDQVAAGRLAWEGFAPVLKGTWTDEPPPRTNLYDFTGKAKPASLATLSRIFALRAYQVNQTPDPNAGADFRLIIRDDYISCTYKAGN